MSIYRHTEYTCVCIYIYDFPLMHKYDHLITQHLNISLRKGAAVSANDKWRPLHFSLRSCFLTFNF